MAKKKTRGGRSTALVQLHPQPLTGTEVAKIAAAVGSTEALGKMPGSGGEFVVQDGVARVTGRDYATTDAVVPAAEIYFDGESRPRYDGPWLGEADKVAWVDPDTGLECIMMRDRTDGFLSGYVGVPDSHPLFGWNHLAIPADLGIEVHGGLTFSHICDDGPSPDTRLIMEARRICHVGRGGASVTHATDHRVEEGQWWFGFDCNHIYDAVPGDYGSRRRFMGPEIAAEYREDGYVVREIRNLAAQLAAIRDGRQVPARMGPPLPPISLDPGAAR
ncbi:hypothetical protein S2M10_22700 [Sphingomonas sp. S2M10]|uniref:hypothetical protein n=1 Tax=Sphingomonas sp. S2M10 TaxID=2705010 RepID=UPI00145774D7|nr:hypothetical protein [Sphingomonas sp. S2M10]NLS27275.1 hypothetical protein [Sphingomonas sp. S2M10]